MSGDTDLQRIARMIAISEANVLRFIEFKFNHLKEAFMPDLTKLSASVDALTAQATVNTKAIADLVALAQANGADQAAIDAITAKVDAATTQLQTDDANDPDAAPTGSTGSSTSGDASSGSSSAPGATS